MHCRRFKLRRSFKASFWERQPLNCVHSPVLMSPYVEIEKETDFLEARELFIKAVLAVFEW